MIRALGVSYLIRLQGAILRVSEGRQRKFPHGYALSVVQMCHFHP